MWDTYLQMLSTGSANCTIVHNPMEVQCPDSNLRYHPAELQPKGYKRSKALKHEYLEKMRSKLAFTGLSKDDIVIEKTSTGATIYVQDRASSKIDTTLDGHDRLDVSSHRKATVVFYSHQPYSELGHSMHPLEDGGLIIGAPGYMTLGSHYQGCVFGVSGPLDR